jgi:hypothetical protein
MKNLILLPIAIVVSFFVTCCSEQSDEEIATRDNMFALHSAMMDYWEDGGEKWPESLEDLRKFSEDFDALMTNPITGDNPGYRYTKPARGSLTGDEGGDEDEDPDAPRSEDIVVIEQLRNGQVDDTLRKLYADGSVR